MQLFKSLCVIKYVKNKYIYRKGKSIGANLEQRAKNKS